MATNPIDDILKKYEYFSVVMADPTVEHFEFKPGMMNRPEAKQELYAAILKCVPEKKERPSSGPQRNGTAQAVRKAHNKAVDEVLVNLAALFDIGGGRK